MNLSINPDPSALFAFCNSVTARRNRYYKKRRERWDRVCLSIGVDKNPFAHRDYDFMNKLTCTLHGCRTIFVCLLLDDRNQCATWDLSP